MNAAYVGEKYWAKPVFGVGDLSARLLIVGLAHGAHGANRTGVPFMGDTAGEFLFAGLERNGFAPNQSFESLKDVYITNAVKCAPPGNKPKTNEFHNCREYLLEELSLLKEVKVILALGEKAFLEVKRTLKEKGANVQHLKFGHGAEYKVQGGFPDVIGSYHTSKLNINTKLIDVHKMDEIFFKIRKIL
ncbi:uracil-DNA glycosylase family protein [Neobacillus drentensis]|uniref:uracil-DNA glycosylase family protein n=1 Tax=Neobacillus drentensis TaxID=220684 RepID=UPI003002B33D